VPGVVLFDRGPPRARLVDEVLAGLSATPKAIGPKWFYDALGSKLFEAICELPEYYLTRTENGLFSQNAAAMAQCAVRDRVLVELGSGSGEKVRSLLRHRMPVAYVAVDIALDILRAATAALAEEHAGLPIFALCADFSAGLELPAGIPEAPRLYFYPGSSIGNFSPGEAIALLSSLARSGDGLLIGVDLLKDRAILEAAYDDALGVTAAFNLNLLARVNRELGADFAIRRFRHVARFDEAAGRIEMHLESALAQQVRIGPRAFGFAAGERLHTENSYKFSVEGFAALAAQAGWTLAEAWVDERRWFAELYFEA
jgi:dimethylhistidine N-methyltransferase